MPVDGSVPLSLDLCADCNDGKPVQDLPSHQSLRVAWRQCVLRDGGVRNGSG